MNTNALTAPQPEPAYYPGVYFSDIFGVDPEVLAEYGAFDIALVNDLPLFVDPFLLYDSTNEKYRALHDGIIEYLCFLRDRAVAGDLAPGAASHWLLFKEVKQNWLGFSQQGNRGTGLGNDFAKSLAKNLTTVFKGFGTETISEASHIEKLGLLSGGVGRDHLSDFTTNLIKGFLLEYTQEFALKHLRPEQRARVRVERVTFDYGTRRWKPEYFELPWFAGDYVILTPKEILTRDEAWINQSDMLDRFQDVVASVPDDVLRAQASEHFAEQMFERMTAKERREAALQTFETFHPLIDHYIKWKEEHADEAHAQSGEKVKETEEQFVQNIKELISAYLEGTTFYQGGTSYSESLRRVQYLKHVIENNDGYRLFYVKGKPVQRETDLHIMYRLTWARTEWDVNAEVNNGRGPVDFKVSKGRKDACLIEFKLAKNTGLEKNLRNQVQIYERASGASNSIKAILYFSESELLRVQGILKKLGIQGKEDIVLIDASRETKASASKADEH